jgi:hypothetical protein
VLVVNAIGLFTYQRFFQKDAWDQAASYVARHTESGDLVVYHAFFTKLPFAFYFRDIQASDYGVPYPAEHYLNLILRQGQQLDSLPISLRSTDIGRITEVIASYRRVWLVSSPYATVTDPQNLVPCVLNQIGTVDAHAEFYRVSVVRYVRRTAPDGGVMRIVSGCGLTTRP